MSSKHLKEQTKISLWMQLFGVLSLIIIVLTIGLGTFVKNRATNIVQHNFKIKVDNISSLFEELLIDNIIINDQTQLTNDIKKLSKINTNLAKLVITNANGYQLIHWQRHNRPIDSSYISISRALHVAGQSYGNMSLHWSTENIRAEVKRRSNTVIIIVLLSLVTLSIPVFLCIKYFVLKPIRHIEMRLKSFSDNEAKYFLPRKEWTTHEFNNLENLADSLASEISARKEAEIQLALAKDVATEANKAKSQFLANMSHELRTPLNAVIGYSELLQDLSGEKIDSDSRADLKKIQHSGEYLLRLVDSVLDLSKIEAGKMELNCVETNVYELVTEVCATIRHLLTKSNSQLEIKCDKHIGYIHTDNFRLRQILYNLLSNAAKFTQNGLVTLHVYRIDQNGKDEITFSVVDTGIGVNKKRLSQLFEPFSQADSGITEKYGGTGLGLSISQKLAQLLGGELSVSSVVGKGSKFVLTLPTSISHLENIHSSAA